MTLPSLLGLPLLTGCAVLSGPCRIESDVSVDRASRTFECQAGGRVLILAPSRALDAAGHSLRPAGARSEPASEAAP
jgi:hypothetical protein